VGHSNTNGMTHEAVSRVPLLQANAVAHAVSQSYGHHATALPVSERASKRAAQCSA
jgi:hypothetical protein